MCHRTFSCAGRSPFVTRHGLNDGKAKRSPLSHLRFSALFAVNWLALLTRSWPPGARCTVYAVFVHPQLEYSAALFALVSLDTKDIKPRILAYHDIWQQLEVSYEEATCRILGQKIFTKSHYSNLGWPTLPERFLHTRNDIACPKPPPNTTNRCRRRLPTKSCYDI